MSTSGESDTSERERPKEVLDDDVSLISVTTGCDQFRSIAFRVFLAVIFLAVGVVAVVYSVYISEKNENEENSDNNNTKTEYFNIRVNQMCDNGTYTLESRLDTTGDFTESIVVRIGTSWVQDNDRERLYHRLGLTSDDWEYTIYAHKSFLIFSTKANCTKDYGMNYDKYLESLGVSSLKKRNRNESVSINGQYYPVIIYDGEPPMSVTFAGQHPNLMFAYVNPNTGATYGWESFFTRTENSSLYRLEYWFPDMSDAPLDQSIFFDFPLNCEEINSTDYSTTAAYL